MFWVLYLLSIIGNIKFLFGFIVFVLMCITVICGITAALCASESVEYAKTTLRITYKIIVATVLVMLIDALIPNEKGITMIIGGSATYEVLQTPEAKEIGGKTLVLLNNKLDELLVEDKPKESK